MTNVKSTNKQISKRARMIISGLLALIMSITVFTGTIISSQAAVAVKTGRFGKGYTTVYLNRDKKGRLQDAKIKVCSFDLSGKKTNAKLHITLRTTTGKWICEFDKTSGNKLKLGKDHSAYRVYISPKIEQSSKDSFFSAINNQSKDFINSGKCVYWSIDASSNCHFW